MRALVATEIIEMTMAMSSRNINDSQSLSHNKEIVARLEILVLVLVLLIAFIGMIETTCMSAFAIVLTTARTTAMVHNTDHNNENTKRILTNRLLMAAVVGIIIKVVTVKGIVLAHENKNDIVIEIVTVTVIVILRSIVVRVWISIRVGVRIRIRVRVRRRLRIKIQGHANRNAKGNSNKNSKTSSCRSRDESRPSSYTDN